MRRPTVCMTWPPFISPLVIWPSLSPHYPSLGSGSWRRIVFAARPSRGLRTRHSRQWPGSPERFPFVRLGGPPANGSRATGLADDVKPIGERHSDYPPAPIPRVISAYGGARWGPSHQGPPEKSSSFSTDAAKCAVCREPSPLSRSHRRLLVIWSRGAHQSAFKKSLCRFCVTWFRLHFFLWVWAVSIYCPNTNLHCKWWSVRLSRWFSDSILRPPCGFSSDRNCNPQILASRYFF